MKYLIILVLLNIIWITLELTRLLLSLFLGLNPTELRIFLGPKLFSCKVKNTNIILGVIPYGATVTYDGEEFNNSKFKRRLLKFYGFFVQLLCILIIKFSFPNSNNDILNKVLLILLILLIAQVSFEVIIKVLNKAFNINNEEK